MECWHWLQWLALAVGSVAALFGLDRLGLWLEDRGWLYYRRRKPTSSPGGFLAMQQFIEPGISHVIEQVVETKHHLRSEKEKQAGRERLISMLVEALTSDPVNVEAIRLHLASAKEMGLDWQALYEKATKTVGEGRLPPLDEVGPTDV
jgi:hypothetical protein